MKRLTRAMAIAGLLAATVMSPAQAVNAPAFDVVSIKPNNSGGGGTQFILRAENSLHQNESNY